jgi:hypothetical protein
MSHPQLTELDLNPIVGVAGIGRMTGGQLPDFINATHAMPDPGNLLMQMCQVLLATGHDAFALDLQARALCYQRAYRIAGTRAPTLRLLALMGPGSLLDNTPLDFIAEHIPVRLDLLFFRPDDAWPAEVPDHDVLMVAVGASQHNLKLLVQIQRLLADWPRPVVNPPECIRRCARDRVYAILGGVPGLHVPVTRKVARAQADWQRYPATIRPLDTQAGAGLARIDSPDALRAYLAAHEDPEFHLADYVEYRSDDGLYRKVRIALIDGRPYVCHLAIAAHWMVHFQTAGMHDSADRRLEEAQLMQDFSRGFGLRHAAALQAIATGLGLDYVVIDCAEAPDGRLLLFEADSRGWIHASDPVDIFPYKPAVMQQAFDAFAALLRRKSLAGAA